MRTRCPHCRTAYDVAPQILQKSQGQARCYRCRQVFNAFQNAFDTPPKTVASESTAEPHPLDESDTSFLADDETIELPGLSSELPSVPSATLEDAPKDASESLELSLSHASEEPAGTDLPDDGPTTADIWVDDSPPLGNDGVLEQSTMLGTPQRKTSSGWQVLLVVLLSLSLLAQLAWLRRDLWIDLPQATQLCAILDCELPDRYRPQDYTVIERNMAPDAGPPAALHLWLAIRNDAIFAQPLPRLQLALQDATGALVARRLFTPEQYLPSDWSGPPAALPGEVVTIELHIKDPGPHVQGFVIDFL